MVLSAKSSPRPRPTLIPSPNLRGRGNCGVVFIDHFHEMRTGRRISPGLTFEPGSSDEERPWAELLTDGTFSAETLDTPPRSFNVSPGWTATLRNSAQKHGATWLHHLHLGVARLEAGDFREARSHFEASADLKENALAFRCLAVLDDRDGNLDAAWSAYQRAWSLSGDDRNLAVEICDFLSRRRRYSEFSAFSESLPAAVAGHERIVLMQAEIALEQGDYPTVRRLLQREFCTIREGEVRLSDLWFASYLREAEARHGRELTAVEKRQIEEEYPPPRAMDFRMQ